MKGGIEHFTQTPYGWGDCHRMQWRIWVLHFAKGGYMAYEELFSDEPSAIQIDGFSERATESLNEMVCCV
jgi:hypothetical protein